MQNAVFEWVRVSVSWTLMPRLHTHTTHDVIKLFLGKYEISFRQYTRNFWSQTSKSTAEIIVVVIVAEHPPGLSLSLSLEIFKLWQIVSVPLAHTNRQMNQNLMQPSRSQHTIHGMRCDIFTNFMCKYFTLEVTRGRSHWCCCSIWNWLPLLPFSTTHRRCRRRY